MRLGAPPSIALLWRRVGLARATELALTGRLVPATEALTLGLVDRVVPPPALRATALAIARDLLDRPPETLRTVKRIADEVARKRHLEALAMEAGETATLLRRPDASVRLAAYRSRLN